MTTTIQASTLWRSTRAMKAEQVRILSANGSISTPKLVMRLSRRAIRPSKQSVKLAAQNTTSATVSLMPERENTAARKTPVSTNRDTVSLLGKFMPGSGVEARVLDYPKAARSFKLPNPCTGLSRGFGDEIIIGMSDHLDGGEFAHRQVAARVNPAVNVGSIGLPASDDRGLGLEFGARRSGGANQAGFPGDAVGVLELLRAGFVFDQHLDRAANEGCADCPGDLELFGHGNIAPLLVDPVRDLARH